MRMLMNIMFPHAEFKDLAEDGVVGDKLKEILAETKPEAVYFTEQSGQRACIMVVDVPEASAIPRLAEPWYLAFEADVEFRVAMTPEDLSRSGLDELGERWT